MRYIGLSFWLVLQIGCLKSQNSHAAQTLDRHRPNIIFIVAESHRAEALGVAGNPFVRTPHLDQLARSGVQFSHAYVTTAICAVSRASLLSGQHRARHGINDFQTNFEPQAFGQTFPMVLKTGGYVTASIGYVGVGNDPPRSSFDYWDDAIPWMAEGVHNTDHIVQKASAWLDGYAGESPFYLYLGFSAAHEIDPSADSPAHYVVQERYKPLYRDVDIPIPKTMADAYWRTFPDFFRTDQNIARRRWHGFLSSEGLFQENARNYYRLITGLDDAVGSIRDKLAELNLTDNTIIVYTSDHGFSLGEHGLMGKWFGFDAGIRVPLLIYDPRHNELQGVKDTSIALNIDIAPTILAMAGLRPSPRMQGINLIDMLDGKVAGRSSFFYEHTVFSSPALPKVEGVVTKTWKYMKYIEHDYESLHDRIRDPEESVDVAGDAAYAGALAEMRRLYEAERAAAR